MPDIGMIQTRPENPQRFNARNLYGAGSLASLVEEANAPPLLVTGKGDWNDGGGADRRHPEAIEPPDLAIPALEQEIRLAFSAQPSHELRTEDLLVRHVERSRERPRRARR